MGDRSLPGASPRVATMPSSAQLLDVLLAGTVAGLVVVFCGLIAFLNYHWFDDEGALLAGFVMLAKGHRLYDEVYSFYGPFYYQVYGAIYGLLGSVTHDAARAATAMVMIACVAMATAVAWGFTRSRRATLVAAIFVTGALSVMPGSPGHPEGLCLVLAFGMLLAAQRYERTGSAAILLLIGGIIAAALATKVNAGLFLGAAWACVVIRVVPMQGWLKLLPAAVAAVVLAAPAAIMWPLMDLGWVAQYATFATLVIALAMGTWWRIGAPQRLSLRDPLVTGAGFAVTLLAIVAVTLLGGTSLPALLEMTVFQTSRFVRNWYIPAQIDIAAWVMLAVALAGTVFCLSSQSAIGPRRRAALAVANGLRIVFVAVYAAAFFRMFLPFYDLFGYAAGRSFWLLVPFAVTAILPRHHGPADQPLARGALVLLCAILVLYPFPVAGHQIEIVSAPLGVLVALALHDLAQRPVPAAGEDARALHAGSLALGGIAAFAGVFLTVGTARLLVGYDRLTPMALPGARFIRIHQDDAAMLAVVTDELRRCGNSYSVPGLMSFHLWAGHALPTALNINNPLGFLTDEQQERIIAALETAPDLCIVYTPTLQAFFDRGQAAARPPLLRYLQESFTPTVEIPPYQILRRLPPEQRPADVLPANPAAR